MVSRRRWENSLEKLSAEGKMQGLIMKKRGVGWQCGQVPLELCSFEGHSWSDALKLKAPQPSSLNFNHLPGLASKRDYCLIVCSYQRTMDNWTTWVAYKLQTSDLTLTKVGMYKIKKQANSESSEAVFSSWQTVTFCCNTCMGEKEEPIRSLFL